jgi:hypothetical protein
MASFVMTWTLDLISLTTGEKVGTLDDRATCSTSQPPPCAVLEVTSTYNLPGGDVASRGQWSSGGSTPAGPAGSPFPAASTCRCPDPMLFEGIGMLVLAD